LTQCGLTAFAETTDRPDRRQPSHLRSLVSGCKPTTLVKVVFFLLPPQNVPHSLPRLPLLALTLPPPIRPVLLSECLRISRKLATIQFSMRPTEQPFQRATSLDASLTSGVDSYIRAMKAFPVLREWELQIALSAHRAGMDMTELRAMTPFRQYLKVEGYRLSHAPYTGTFTKLFAESGDIPHLVALGIFPTVSQWVHQWITLNDHPGLPLEEFFQDALQHYIPYSAEHYQPVEEATFRTYAVNMLQRRFTRFVQRWQQERTTPEGFAQGATGRPKETGRRRVIDSVQRVLPETGSDDFEQPSLSGTSRVHTLLDLLDQRSQPQGEDDLEKVALYAVVSDLARRAQLSSLEGTVIVGLFVDQLCVEEVAYLLRKTEGQIRDARHRAMERFRDLGKGTVSAILAGEPARRAR
jgi:DNA-directed RNA polymerase specialized sigma24 family protein